MGKNLIQDKKYYTYMEYIGEIYLMGNEVEACSHPGQCDDDCRAVRERGTIHEQLAKFPDEALLKAINAYGCELPPDTKRETLEEYVIWLAANDINEGQYQNEES